MLVCSVVLQTKHATLAAAVTEATDATDTTSLGVVFANLVDAPGAAIDHLDAFVGLLIGEAANAAAVVNAGSIRNAAIVEQTNAIASSWIPGTYALAIAEHTTAGATQSSAIGLPPGVVAGTLTETAAAIDAVFTSVAVTSGMVAVLDGTLVDPRSPSSLLGTDVLDSGPVIALAAGGSFESGGGGSPATGIPVVPPGGAVDGGAGTWTVPAGWDNGNNSIECIGGGAGGMGAGVIMVSGGPGGGGGAYSKISNVTLTPGAVINFHIGEGGAWNGNGGDTWFGSTSTVYAQGGKGQTGGQASAGIGTVKYSGGNGGSAAYYAVPAGNLAYGAGGGGGAAGPNGGGANGGNGYGANGANGGGGGAGSGGSPGGNALSPAIGGEAGTGGNSYLGTGGGAGGSVPPPYNVNLSAGAAGVDGGGGGGSSAASPNGTVFWSSDGGKGGNGREWGKNIGAGGGGGGSGACVNGMIRGGQGGYYGGGGGGLSSSAGGQGLGGGAGAAGIIIIKYG
jgi:hypothetical protein